MALFTAAELEDIRRADKEISRQINEESWTYRNKKPRTPRPPKTEEQIAEQRQKRIDYQRRYRETHREEIRKYRMRPDVRERQKEYYKAYYAENRERLIEKSGEYQRANKERCNAQKRKYAQKMKELNINGKQ